MPTVVVRSRGGTVLSLPLFDRPLVIGRAETCDIVLRQDAEVSREHAQIWVDDDGFVYVADRNSKNGTRVDEGEPFRNAARTVRRTIRIGEHELEILGASTPSRETVRFASDPPLQRTTAQFYPSTHIAAQDLSQQRLSILIGLAERIGSAFDRKQLLEQALDACCEALGFERGLIALKTGRGETEHPVTRNIQRDETGAYKVSRSLIRGALEEGKLAVVNDPATDLVNTSESVVRLQIRSALCAPILNRDRILGVIYGDCIREAAEYTANDVEFLGAIARQVGVGLTNLRLLQDYVENQRLDVQLEQARRFQQRLLPHEPLRAGRIVVTGYNEPSERVGGDYFGYFDLGDGRVAFIIADVAGHGLPAAMLMANFQAVVQVTLSADVPLTELVERVNRFCCRSTAMHEFITGVIGLVDTRTGVMEFVSAGHPAPILLGPDGVRIPEVENSLPLGIEPGEKYVVRRVDPRDGVELALFYTDGLFEAEGPGGTQLGILPVCGALRELPERSCDSVIQATLQTWRAHLSGNSAQDDLTLKAIQLNA
jgi:sigma-B regulation protein RsbU (phosphoserine phosphatase)